MSAMMRECKCLVSVTGLLNGERYSESFITQGRCADHAVGKVAEHVAKYQKNLTQTNLLFKDWFTFDSTLAVQIP